MAKQNQGNSNNNAGRRRGAAGTAAGVTGQAAQQPGATQAQVSAPTAREFNSGFVGGDLCVQRGTANPVWLRSHFRSIERTELPATGKVRAIPRFLTVMMDKRAPGLWAGVIGGPKSKVEYLAELAVDNAILPQVAAVFSDHSLMGKLNDNLLKGNQRYKSGVFSTDYLSLLNALTKVVGASQSVRDPNWVVARILTELLSRAYTKMNVMVPFVGAADVSAHIEPVATLADLIRVSQIALVTEVFEAIELGSAFDGAKEFNPAIAEALIGPLLTQAANRINNALRYEKYMRDSAVLVGQFLVDPSLLPSHLQDHADIQYLATNASFALGAIDRAYDTISTPAFDLEKALQYTVMRLREMKRFESWSLEKFASHYSVEQVRSSVGYIAGLCIMRHDPVKVTGQVTRYVRRSDIVVQLPSQVGEAYLSPLVEAVNSAFAGSTLQKHVSVVADYLIKQAWDLNGADFGGYVFTFGMSTMEERILGLAYARHMAIAGIDPDGLTKPTLTFETVDHKMFYEPAAVPSGGGFITVDPLEAVLLANTEQTDPAPFPLKPQVLLDESRRLVLLEAPREYPVDGATLPGLVDLSQTVRIRLPQLDSTPVERNDSLQDLLGLAEVGQLDLTVELAHRATVSGAFAALAATYAELIAAGSVAHKMEARGVALAIHSLVTGLASHASFVPLLRTMMLRLVNDPAFAARRQAMRNHLNEAHVRHHLALATAFMVLLKTGLLEFGVHEDIVKIFEREEIVNVAITSDLWQKALNTRS